MGMFSSMVLADGIKFQLIFFVLVRLGVKAKHSLNSTLKKKKKNHLLSCDGSRVKA